MDDFGVNLHYYGFRMYDPAIARFTTIDPLAEAYHFQSGFAYAVNNPILYRDIMGLGVETKFKKEGTDEVVEVNDGIDKTIVVNETDFDKAKGFTAIDKKDSRFDVSGDDWTQENQQDYYEFYNSVNSFDELSVANVYDYFFGGPDDGVIEIAPGLPGGKAGGTVMKGAAKPSISAIKKALKKVYKELGIDGPLPKAKPGRFGSPARGTGKKGYRLDPPHDNHKKFWHIDYWTGKRKAGKMDHIKID